MHTREMARFTLPDGGWGMAVAVNLIFFDFDITSDGDNVAV